MIDTPGALAFKVIFKKLNVKRKLQNDVSDEVVKVNKTNQNNVLLNPP